MVQTKTLRVDERFGSEYAGEYVFKEISWAKRNRIIQKHTVYSKLTGRVESSDYIAIQAETVMASLHSQPQTKPLTLHKLLSEDDNGVPIELGEVFAKLVNSLNGLTRDETDFLFEQSKQKSPIQASTSLGSAKSSDGP